jgi:hypothetical protein
MVMQAIMLPSDQFAPYVFSSLVVNVTFQRPSINFRAYIVRSVDAPVTGMRMILW